MTGNVHLTVNPEVFKIVDSRVALLSAGKISVEAFANMVTSDDPFILIGGTIYALTEAEYYATRAIAPLHQMTEDEFKYVLELEDKSFMHELDRKYLAKVKEDLPVCPACRYKRYKEEVEKLVHKYNIKLPETDKTQVVKINIPAYPSVTGHIVPLASIMMQHMYAVDIPMRRACIDCVEKHIAQAWVLSNEVVSGYQEHMTYMIGHLAEALDEMPVGRNDLKATVEFCLAYARKYDRPFVPLGLLTSLINVARNAMGQSMDDQTDAILDNRSESMELDFTDNMKNELMLVPVPMLEKIFENLGNADKIATDSTDENGRLVWEGAVACAGDTCAKLCPEFANMLRNRRLIFIGDIASSLTTGYGFVEIREWIGQYLAKMN